MMLIKPFLSTRNYQMISCHMVGSETLFESVPRELLPNELGEYETDARAVYNYECTRKASSNAILTCESIDIRWKCRSDWRYEGLLDEANGETQVASAVR
jgi:hypothetical protein